MLIALLISLTIVGVIAAGEAVRGQCRRMLARPVGVAAAPLDKVAARSEAVA